MSSSRESSQLRDQTQVSCYGRRAPYHGAPAGSPSHELGRCVIFLQSPFYRAENGQGFVQLNYLQTLDLVLIVY